MSGFLSTADVAIIIGSVVLVVAVGLWVGRKRTETAEGYFMANNRMPWYVIGCAFVASGISSEQMIGTVGVTYKYGLSIANWEWFLWPTYTLPLLIFIPIFLRNKVVTVPGFLSARFGPAVGSLYSAFLLFIYVFVHLPAVLYSGSLAFSQVTGWNFYLVVVVTAVAVGAYSIKGGLRSVMFTDVVQCLLLTVGGVLLFWLAMSRLPGGITGAWADMEAASPARMHLYEPPDHPMAPMLGMFLAVFGVFTFYQVGNQAMIQRMLAARSTWDGLMGMVMASFLGFLRPMVTCFLGLVVYHWIFILHRAAPLKDQDLAFTFALANLAPGWGVRGIVLAGLIAAVMATISALVNSISTMFATDFYKKFLHTGASDPQMVATGRLSSLAALAIAACVAPLVGRFGGIFKYTQEGMTYLACPFMATILMGVLWKRVNYAAGVFGFAGGLVIQIVVALLFSGNVPGLPALHFFYVGAIAEVLTIIGIVIVTLATPPPDAARVKPMIWSPALLKSYDGGRGRPWYQQVKVWWALFFLGNAALYWRFW
jgi:solute:Na+ symporter, SSS family